MRYQTSFNDGWKFFLGEQEQGQSPEHEDHSWQAIALPHDWSIAEPFDPQWASATGFLPGGIGWYRKSFADPRGSSKDNVSLLFDGIYCGSDIWLNGHHIASRPHGFTSFFADLTPHLQTEAANTLAVRVDHSRFADARWYTGSGINRNVSLLVTGPVCIKPWGVFVTCVQPSRDQADIHIEVTAQNHSQQDETVCVRQTLLDQSKKTVAQQDMTFFVPAHGESTGHQSISVDQPRLWSPESPELYLLRTEIVRQDEAVDQTETPFGIRFIHFDPDTGFFLNGQNRKIKGVCLHDDAGALGTAVPSAVWKRRLLTLKEAGVDAIRMSHNPHMPELYDLCDQLGFLVQDEAFDEWELGKRKWVEGWTIGEAGTDGPSSHFAEWAERDLIDMILRDRNHPSIIMWSIGNEVDTPNDPYTHELLDSSSNPQAAWAKFDPRLPHAARLGEIAEKLAAIVRRCDDTRPVTAALASAHMSNQTSFPDCLDIVGYNYQEGLYATDHASYPSRVIYGSENGMSESAWRAVTENDYICGQFLWTGIDYLGEAGRWPLRSNGSGLLDLAGFPKPEFYFRQSLWAEKPMVYIGASRTLATAEKSTLWSHKQAEPLWEAEQDEMIRVSCFTNCEQAELFINSRSCGCKSLAEANDHVLFWDIPYEAGIVRVAGMQAGKQVAAHELHSTGTPTQLKITTDKETLMADGVDLAHIVVTALDKDGRPVYGAASSVYWTIQGPVRLLGIENGSHASHEDYQAGHHQLFHGRQLGYLQAAGRSGTAKITVSAENLTEASLSMAVTDSRRTP